MWFKRIVESFTKEQGPSPSELAELERLIEGLSADEAVNRVESLLADPEKYSVTRAVRTSAQVAGEIGALGALTRRFFGTYQTVVGRYSDVSIVRDEVARSPLGGDLTTLGHTTADSEIVARPDDDRVFVVDGTESEEQFFQDSYPSIYHYILWNAYLVYPEIRR